MVDHASRHRDDEEDAVTDFGGVPVDPANGHRDKVDFTGVRWKSVEWTNVCLLYLRACESRLAESILGDELAACDVARIEYDFERVHRTVRPEINQFMVALRSAQFDALTNQYLNAHPDAVVLHLGCGLHSRAFRVAARDGGRPGSMSTYPMSSHCVASCTPSPRPIAWSGRR